MVMFWSDDPVADAERWYSSLTRNQSSFEEEEDDEDYIREWQEDERFGGAW